MADEPRRPGRPRLDPDAVSVSVTVRVSPKHYDALYTSARRERKVLAAYLRDRLVADDTSPATPGKASSDS